MQPQDFCYWLQGFAELHTEPPTAEQWESIRQHLNLVFTKVTPALGTEGTELGLGKIIEEMRKNPIQKQWQYPYPATPTITC